MDERLTIRNADDLETYAKALAAVHGGEVEEYKGLILIGWELGFGPASSVLNFHIFRDRDTKKATGVRPSARALVAIARRRELFRDLTISPNGKEKTGAGVTVSLFRTDSGKKVERTFTVQDALDRKLYNPNARNVEFSPWRKDPLNMCENRAISALFRSEFPEILMAIEPSRGPEPPEPIEAEAIDAPPKAGGLSAFNSAAAAAATPEEPAPEEEAREAEAELPKAVPSRNEGDVINEALSKAKAKAKAQAKTAPARKATADQTVKAEPPKGNRLSALIE